MFYYHARINYFKNWIYKALWIFNH